MNGLNLAFVLGTMSVILASCRETTGAGCANILRDSNCKLFQRDGHCPTDWMKVECSKTCGYCNEEAPTCDPACTNGNTCNLWPNTCECGGNRGCTGNDMCTNNKCVPLMSRTKMTVDGIPEANGLNCWTCPLDNSGQDGCLIDGTKLGKSEECSPHLNSCGTLIVDDDTAPIRYSRGCGSGKDGCEHLDIRLKDKYYPARICFCSTGDDCNTKV